MVLAKRSTNNVPVVHGRPVQHAAAMRLAMLTFSCREDTPLLLSYFSSLTSLNPLHARHIGAQYDAPRAPSTDVNTRRLQIGYHDMISSGDTPSSRHTCLICCMPVKNTRMDWLLLLLLLLLLLYEHASLS